jgi:hypothetical protein
VNITVHTGVHRTPSPAKQRAALARKLTELHHAGLLTAEELETKRAQLADHPPA